MSEVARAYVSITANTTGLVAGLTAAEAQVRGFSGRNDGAATRSGNAWRTMGRTTAGGLALATVGIGYAVNAAADFEQTMSEVESVTGASTREMGQLERAAMTLGASTKYSAGEVAGAQVELGKAGLSASQIIGGALPAALALAAAGNLDLSAAAQFTVRAMDQFGLAASDTTRIADAFAAAANITTGDVNDFGMALSQGGATARAAGLSFDETMVALTALGRASVFGSDAGTSLKAALTQLIAPTTKQARAAEAAGLSFIDAAGNMRSMAEISAMLRERTEGMTRAQRTALFTTLAGTDGVRTLLALYNAGPAALNGYERSLTESGTAARVAAVQQDNLRGRLEQLQGAAETAAIKFGSVLIPMLSDGADAAADFIAGVADSGDIERWAERTASAVQTGAQVMGAAWDIAGPLLADAAGIAGDAIQALGSLAGGAAPTVALLATGAGTLAGAVLGIVGPITSTVAALAGVPGVAQGATAAMVGLGASILVLKGAGLATTIHGWASAWAPYVSLAGRAAAESFRAGGAMGVLRFALGGLTTPAGLAAAGIGLLVGGLTMLVASSGPSMAERMASALGDVAREADTAKGAIDRFRGATDALGDAEIRQRGAVIELKSAQQQLNQMRREGTASALDLQRAELRVDQAQVEVNRSTRDLAQSNREVRSEATASVTALARLATAQGRAAREAADQERTYQALSRSMNVSETVARDLAREHANLATQGATTDARMTALRGSITQLAGQMDTSTRAGRETHAILTRIAALDNQGLVEFAGSLQTLERRGVPQAQALERALSDALRNREARLSANGSSASHTADGVDNRLDSATRARTAQISADGSAALHTAAGVTGRLLSIPDRTITVGVNDLASAKLGGIGGLLQSLRDRTITVTTRPVHLSGSPKVYETIDMIEGLARNTLAHVTFRPHGSGAVEAAMPGAGASLTGPAHALMAHYADPMRGGSSLPMGGVGAGPVHIQITVVDQTLAGMSREQARRLADQIGPALDRRVTART